MHLKSVFSILLLVLSAHLFAQQEHICINDQVQLKENKGTYTPFQVPALPENIATKYVNTVIHIIYFNDTDSIPSETIEAVIQDLNSLFRAEDIDTSLINPVHRDKLMDTQIQFCLAKTDPDGEPTKGINYVQTDVEFFPIQYSLNGITAELVKNEFFGGVAPWDIDRYFNIWIAAVGTNGENFSYGIPREEYAPLINYTPANTIPGALIDVDNLTAPPPLGTLKGLFAHECGHSLGLLHTFHISGIDTVEFCDGTDFMDDTPTAAPTNDCPASFAENTCTDPLDDEPDNTSNFMNFACQLMFTPDQIATMHNNLSLAPSGLYEEAACELISSVENNRQTTDFDFKVYPNPNDGNFVVQLHQPYLSAVVLSLYNSVGQVIFTEKAALDNTFSFPVNRNELEKGIYYLTVRSTQGIFSKKLVVQ